MPPRCDALAEGWASRSPVPGRAMPAALASGAGDRASLVSSVGRREVLLGEQRGPVSVRSWLLSGWRLD